MGLSATDIGRCNSAFLRPPTEKARVSRELDRPAAPINEAMLKKGIILRPVPNYGFPNALRMTIGRPHENERMLRALKEVLAAP